jgi:hypothetical protein
MRIPGLMDNCFCALKKAHKDPKDLALAEEFVTKLREPSKRHRDYQNSAESFEYCLNLYDSGTNANRAAFLTSCQLQYASRRISMENQHYIDALTRLWEEFSVCIELMSCLKKCHSLMRPGK